MKLICFFKQLLFLVLGSMMEGTRATKVIASFTFGYLLFPFRALFEKYIFSDWEGLGYLIVLLICDTIIGVWKHIKLKTVSKDGFGRFVEKLLLILVSLITSHVVHQMYDATILTETLQWTVSSGLGLWLLISILSNMASITDGKFPPRWILDRLRQEYAKGNKPKV